MNQRIVVIALLAAGMNLTGCALTIHDTPVNYQYSGSVIHTAANENVSAIVTNVTDERTVDRPDIISHLVNGYGQTMSGGYVAEVPVSEIVKSGIAEGLAAAGYSHGDDGLQVEATLDDYEYDAVSGFWSVKNITAKITIGVRVFSGGQAVSRNTVIGNVKLESEALKGKPDKQLVVMLFAGALDNAVDQVVEIVNIEANRR